MKSFKSHVKENQTFNKDEITEWCLKNIVDYDTTLLKHYEHDAIKPSGKYPLVTARGSLLHIKTQDAKLPMYNFYTNYDYIIEAPNLIEFEFDAFVFDDIQYLTFRNDTKLLYGSLDYTQQPSQLKFENVFIIEPKDLRGYEFDTIFFDSNNTSVHDFDNYNNLDIQTLRITQHQKFKNISNLLDDSVEISKIRFLGVDVKNAGFNVNIIVNKYLFHENKSQYIMDFTVEMIDCGFEDML